MKTNQVMIRENEAFLQRTKDGYFSGNSLLNNWNEENPKSRKDMNSYKVIKSTKVFIDQLESEGIGSPMLSSRKGTWMHPKLFIDFAMWISPVFKSQVIDYVLDGLINSRIDAGDYHKQMCAQIIVSHYEAFKRKPNPNVFINESRFIKKALDISKTDRNEMTEKELSDITMLQKINTVMIKQLRGKKSRQKQLIETANALKL